jgi:serine/threonine protein kinase
MLEALGQYRILDPIGSGGIGDVYRARDTRLGRTVALRILAPSIANDPEQRERFMHDAHASARVSHPNIAALYEIGEDQALTYLACEFVNGQTLKNIGGGHALNPRRAIDLAIQIGDALAEAFAAGLVHGDIKADNVVVTPKGSVKLLDFGLAAWTASGADCSGRAVDHQGDIFKLGQLLFEMLTGKRPTGIRTLTAVDPHLPRELDPIVLKALATNRRDRYESAATFAAQLRAAAAILDARSDRDELVPMPPARPLWRTPAVGWAAATLAMGAIAWLIWMATRAS